MLRRASHKSPLTKWMRISQKKHLLSYWISMAISTVRYIRDTIMQSLFINIDRNCHFLCWFVFMTWVIFLCSLLDHPVGDCDLADLGLERQMIASGSCIILLLITWIVFGQIMFVDYSKVIYYKGKIQEIKQVCTYFRAWILLSSRSMFCIQRQLYSRFPFLFKVDEFVKFDEFDELSNWMGRKYH